jgi:hypothetical protein
MIHSDTRGAEAGRSDELSNINAFTFLKTAVAQP